MGIRNVLVGLILLVLAAAVLAPTRASAQGLTLGDYAATLNLPGPTTTAPTTAEPTTTAPTTATELQLDVPRGPLEVYLDEYDAAMRLAATGRATGIFGLGVASVGVVLVFGCLFTDDPSCIVPGVGMLVVGGSLAAFGAIAAPWGSLRAAHRLRLLGARVTTFPGTFSAVTSGLTVVSAFIPGGGLVVVPGFLLSLIASELQSAANRRAHFAARFDAADFDETTRAEFSINPMRIDHGGWGAALTVTF